MAELRKDSLSFIETLGQSVANVSPTLTPALSVAVVAGAAGTASWFIFVLATVALLVVGINVGKLAARMPGAGSFFIYVSRSLGSAYGLLAGWSMLAAYLTTAIAVCIATSIFFKTMLTALGVTAAPPNILIYFVISALAWLLACLDIRMSSRVGLTLEVISVAIILAVCFNVLAGSGFQIDAKQLSLKGIEVGSAAQAIVFAIFCYVGFESAATLGDETRNPTDVIPKAITWTAIASGTFFVFVTYVIVQAFGDDTTKLAASAAPMADILTGKSPWLTAVVYFGATISAFACVLASLNAFGRLLFSLGRYQFMPASMGTVHSSHQTPYVALTLGAAMNFIVCSAFVNQGESDVFGWFGTLASFGFIIVYFLCSVATPVYLKKTGTCTAYDVAMGGLGAVLMVLSLIGSLYPIPAYPLNLLPYIFLAYMMVGVVWFFIVKGRAPGALESLQKDIGAPA